MTRAGYRVKELYFTLQGEGARTGRPAVFCRFAGCNLWSGRERDRVEASCYFCDTDFVGTDGPGGGEYANAATLAERVADAWPGNAPKPYLVFTGGEPLLQLDGPLIEACHRSGFEIGIETNGTLPVPAGVDWVCVSPKPNSDWIVRQGHELKLVYPMEISPTGLDGLAFDHFFVQPLAGPELERNTERARAWCREHPPWRLSLQTHKLMGLP